MKTRPNWRKSYDAAIGGMKLAEDAAMALRVERDGLEATCATLTQQVNALKQVNTSPTIITKEVVLEKEVMPFGTGALFFTLLLAWLIVVLWAFDETSKINHEPVVQYRYVAGHTVFLNDPKQQQILKDCQDEWRLQNQTIRYLRHRLRKEP